MADEIRQTLGFDVNDGLANIERFGKAISNLSNRITRFGTSLEKFNTRFSGSTVNMTSASDASDRMSRSMANLERNTGRLTTSFELLSRIVYTQLVIKGLRLAETAMSDAASRAADLEVALAKVRTVAGDVFPNIPDIGKAVESQSSELGIDQLKIADGLYQALQNQIGGTKAELLDFNRVASQFAIGTVTDQNNAIELLSGTLNAYGLDVSRAEELASKFNKTIELGNVEGSQLATVFGRVSTRGAQLGVSFEELNGLLATLTIRGVKASEAATQVSGILSAFAKPSEAMKAALERLNAPSGEFLIRSTGLANALQQLRDQTDGSSTELAKLFPNVRALNGASIAASDNVALLARNIEAIQNTANSLNKERFDTIFNTDAKRLEKEMNDFRIELTKTGREILSVTAATLDFAGGAENIISAAKNAAPAIGALALASATYAANTRIAALEGTKLSKVLSGLSKLGIGAGLAVSLGKFIGSELDESRFTKLRQLEAANDRIVQKFIDGEQDRLAAARKADDKIVESALAASRTQVKAFNDANAALLADQNRVQALVSGTIGHVIQTREDLVRELERTANDSFNAIEQSQRRINSLKFDQEQRTFDVSLSGLSDPEKAQRTLQRSVELAERAGSALKRAQNQSQIGDAERLFDTAKRTAETAQQLAERLNDRKLENAAAFTLNKLTEDQISAERQLQSLQERRLKLSDSEADKERAVTDELKASQKALLDTLNIVGTNPADLEKLASVRQDALNRILKAGFDKGDVNLADSLGLSKLAAEMQRNPIPITFDVNSAVERLTTGIQTALKDFKVNLNFDVSGLEGALGRQFRTPDEIAAGLADAKNEADQLRTSLSKIDQDRVSALTGIQDEIRALLDSSKGVANSISKALLIEQPDLQKGEQIIAAARAQAESLSQSATITHDQVTDLFSKVEQLASIQNKVGSSIFGSGGGFSADIEALSTVAEKLLQVANLPSVDPQTTARLQTLEAVIQSSQTAATSIETSLTRGASALIGAADRLETAAARLSAAPLNRAFGGPVYRASGGAARGTDTIPAMLSRGEFVMNKKATQRFYSDFQRMNAGMTPTYRNAGGTVNNTVGDIHIHESKRPSQTAREIIRQINREHRKGTARIR